MGTSDQDTTLQDLKVLVSQFRDERGWAKHHTPKNLAISIMIEAAELLEHFRWDALETKDKAAIADELADVLSYCFNFDPIRVYVGSYFPPPATLETA